MSLIHELLVDLLDLFVEVSRACVEFAPKVLVMVCLQVVKVYALGKITFAALVEVWLIVLFMKLVGQEIFFQLIII